MGWSETTSGRAGQRRCRSTLRRHAAAALRQSLAALAILPIKAGKQPLRLRLDARRSRSTLLPNLPAAPLVHPLLIEPMQTPQTEERRPERFAAYIAARRFDPPRSLLIRAADLAESKDHALDAGAGALNATRYLLSAGFKHVTALDSSPVSQTVAAELPREQVRFVLSRFEDYDYPDRAYEFVNAEFSLPFISAAAFPSVFTKLMASVKISGLFTGQLFGPQLEPAGKRDELSLAERCRAAAAPLDPPRTHRRGDRPGKTKLGEDKHWHIFHIIARCPANPECQRRVV